MSNPNEIAPQEVSIRFIRPKKKEPSSLEKVFALCDADAERRARESERRNIRNISFDKDTAEAEKLLLMENVRISIRTNAGGYTDRVERRLQRLQHNDPSPKVRRYAGVLLKTGADREDNNKLFMDILLRDHDRFDIYPHTRKEKSIKAMLNEARREMEGYGLPVMRSPRRLLRTRFAYDPRL